MVLRRTNVLWKRDGTRLLIMAKGEIFSLNEKGAAIWESLDGKGGAPEDRETLDFVQELESLGLVEEVED